MGYVLFDEIASGGMASVHFGRLSGPVGFSRVVAIKRLHKHLAGEGDFVTMFLDEARLAARVHHTNVIPTIDVVAGDEVFIVMEYIQGESLSRLIRAEKARGQPVPMPYALAIMAGTLHGLNAAHDATDERGAPLNIVHRDVSPQNVIVGSDGVPRVFDFGVAKAAGRLQNTRDGSLKGKIAYMSPEQLAGRDVSRRSDIYSASVMLWELLAGRRLFDGDNEASIIPKIMAAQIVPPSQINPAVPKALDDITMHGLAFDSNKRYPTAKVMAQEIERSGGLVSASELGDWVKELAHEAIAKRARRIADIESRDVSEVSSGAGMMQGSRFNPVETIPPGSASTGAGAMSMPVDQNSRRVWTDAATNPGSSAQLRSFSDPPHTPSVNSMQYPRISSGAPGGPGQMGQTTSPVDLSTQGAMSLAQPPSRRGGAVVGLAVLMLLVLGGGGFVAWHFGRSRVGPAAPSPSASATAPQTTPSALPSAGSTTEAVPPSTGTAPQPAKADAGPKVTTSATSTGTNPPPKPPTTMTPPRPSTPTAPHPPKDDCDPPYVIDADGHKSYKRNCLGQ